ncbi:MAG: hypothetical protein KY445_17060, partial [Armatimonadetes bacterium]|nr:hypothetical protein [Armatimonadota bacterium]
QEIKELAAQCVARASGFDGSTGLSMTAVLDDAGYWLNKLWPLLTWPPPKSLQVPEPEPDDSQWAIVELMGHTKMAGRVSEETKFGTVMGRIDIPKGDAFVTTYFSGGSVYRVTPCDEKSARDVAEYGYVRRVPSALPPSQEDEEEYENPFADD